ncbi:methyltransferase [Peteryoungia desertarenae]|nr:methyltransferase [Peteryoungia desertarenae]
MFHLVSGFVHSQILWTCVRLDLFNVLVDRCLSTNELAKHCDLPIDRMRLLLQQAERLGLILSQTNDRWLLDDAGAVIASDRGLALMVLHHQMFYRDLLKPDDLLRSQYPQTELASYWAYAHHQAPEAIGDENCAPYSELMRESQAMMTDCILGSHHFGNYRTVTDVGGGEAAFLTALGQRYNKPYLSLFDLPAVAKRARKRLEEAKLTQRAEVHGGDFSKDELPADRLGKDDCVTLIRILCDHDDDRVLRILRNLHRSMQPGCHLIVAEAMAGKSGGSRLAALYFSHYFLAMGSGRCRSTDEIRALLTEAGFVAFRARTSTNPLLATLVLAQR